MSKKSKLEKKSKFVRDIIYILLEIFQKEKKTLVSLSFCLWPGPYNILIMSIYRI